MKQQVSLFWLMVSQTLKQTHFVSTLCHKKRDPFHFSNNPIEP